MKREKDYGEIRTVYTPKDIEGFDYQKGLGWARTHTPMRPVTMR